MESARWGRLTGKLSRGKPLPEVSRLHEAADFGPQVPDEQLYRVTDELEALASETGKTVPQIALIGCCNARPCRPS